VLWPQQKTWIQNKVSYSLILSLTGDVVGFAGTFGFDTAEPSDPIPTPVPPDFTKVA
jgi:hypothetical protein